MLQVVKSQDGNVSDGDPRYKTDILYTDYRRGAIRKTKRLQGATALRALAPKRRALAPKNDGIFMRTAASAAPSALAAEKVIRQIGENRRPTRGGDIRFCAKSMSAK
jgi:hypothetical protein